MADFALKFDTKPHVVARYTGPKDQATVVQLLQFLLHERWRGQLVVNLTGNGGISDIVFSEVKTVVAYMEEKS